MGLSKSYIPKSKIKNKKKRNEVAKRINSDQNNNVYFDRGKNI